MKNKNKFWNFYNKTISVDSLKLFLTQKGSHDILQLQITKEVKSSQVFHFMDKEAESKNGWRVIVRPQRVEMEVDLELISPFMVGTVLPCAMLCPKWIKLKVWALPSSTLSECRLCVIWAWTSMSAEEQLYGQDSPLWGTSALSDVVKC
jgi:hypothetical protein